MTIKKFICAFGILGSLKVWGADGLPTIEEERIDESTQSTLNCENALDEEIKKQSYRYTELYGQAAQLVAQIEEEDANLKLKSSKSSGYKQRQLSAKERNKWIKWRIHDLQSLTQLKSSIQQSFDAINISLNDCNKAYDSALSGQFYDHDYSIYNRGYRFFLQLQGFVNSYMKTLERLQK